MKALPRQSAIVNLLVASGVIGAPTRFGPVSFSYESRADKGEIRAEVMAPSLPGSSDRAMPTPVGTSESVL